MNIIQIASRHAREPIFLKIEGSLAEGRKYRAMTNRLTAIGTSSGTPLFSIKEHHRWSPYQEGMITLVQSRYARSRVFSSPNIIDVVTTRDRRYYIEEYVPGGNLDDLQSLLAQHVAEVLSADSPLCAGVELPRISPATRTACRRLGLHQRTTDIICALVDKSPYLEHDLRYFHGDLLPRNVILATGRDRPVVVDFDLAKATRCIWMDLYRVEDHFPTLNVDQLMRETMPQIYENRFFTRMLAGIHNDLLYRRILHRIPGVLFQHDSLNETYRSMTGQNIEYA